MDQNLRAEVDKKPDDLVADTTVQIVVVEPDDIKKEEPIEYTQPIEKGLGRLKRTLSEKCTLCGHPLQLRVRQIENLLRGETIVEDETYKKCSVCDYEEEMEQKRRKNTFDKTALKKEDVPLRSDRRDDNNGHQKRSGVVRGSRDSGKGSSGRGNRRNSRAI